VIKENEDLYRELFFADYNPDKFNENIMDVQKIWRVFYDSGILKQIVDSGFPFDSNSSESGFNLVREAYTRKILGDGQWEVIQTSD
jgi:hypothetical protein